MPASPPSHSDSQDEQARQTATHLFQLASELGYMVKEQMNDAKSQLEKIDSSPEKIFLDNPPISASELDYLLSKLPPEHQDGKCPVARAIEDKLFLDLIQCFDEIEPEDLQKARDLQAEYWTQGIKRRLKDVFAELGYLSSQQLSRFFFDQERIHFHCSQCKIDFHYLKMHLKAGKGCPRCQGPAEKVKPSPEEVTPDQARADSAVSKVVSYSPGEKLGPWVLIHELGRGSMGVVFQAVHRDTGQEVALKLLPHKLWQEEKSRLRFLREIKSLVTIRHPHVVSLYDAGEDNDTIYMALQAVTNGSLKSAQEQDLDLYQKLKLFHGSLLGLKAIHDARIIHRDIKPENILLDHQNLPLISDFGIARRENESLAITNPGEILGTPAFMSPEQCRAEPCDYRSDIYSLGVTFYEIFAGELPFKGGYLLEIVQSILEGKPALLAEKMPEVPHRLRQNISQVIHKMMALAPKHRFQTVDEILQEF